MKRKALVPEPRRKRVIEGEEDARGELL